MSLLSWVIRKLQNTCSSASLPHSWGKEQWPHSTLRKLPDWTDHLLITSLANQVTRAEIRSRIINWRVCGTDHKGVGRHRCDAERESNKTIPNIPGTHGFVCPHVTFIRLCSCIDSFVPIGNYTRFINHSCAPNSQFQKFTWLGTERILLVSKGIDAGEEITVDYSHEYWEGLDKKCLCGEACCRYVEGAAPPSGWSHLWSCLP